MKPWRQALWTKADANHDFPIPVGPGDQQIVMVANPRAGAEAQDHLAIEPARRGEIDILERGRIAQLGVPQALRESPVLARGPFGVDQQAEAVLKPQLGVLARARVAGQRPSAIAIRRRAWSFSIVGCVSIGLLVVGGAAQVLVRQRRTGRRGVLERQPVLLVDENVFDGAIAIGAQPLGAVTRGFESIGAMDAAEPHQPEARAVALLGMRAVLEDARDEPAGGRAGLFRPTRSGATASIRRAPDARAACARPAWQTGRGR